MDSLYDLGRWLRRRIIKPLHIDNSDSVGQALVTYPGSDGSLESQWSNVSAEFVDITDDGGDYAATTVEGALEEIVESFIGLGSEYLKLDGSNDPVTGNLEIGSSAGSRAEIGTSPASSTNVLFGNSALDHSDLTQYAILQSIAGRTHLNGVDVVLLKNLNVTQAAVHGTGIAFAAGKVLSFSSGTTPTSNGDWQLSRTAANEATIASGDKLHLTTAPAASDDSTLMPNTAWVQDELGLYIPKSLLTTRGDLIRRGASAPERVALGTVGQVLGSDGTDAVWHPPCPIVAGIRLTAFGTHTSSGNFAKMVTGGTNTSGTFTWESFIDTKPTGLSSGVDAANGRLYARLAGLYRVTYFAQTGPMSAAGRIQQTELRVNGATSSAGDAVILNGSAQTYIGAASSESLTYVGFWKAAAGDYINMWHSQNDSASEAFRLTNFMLIEYMGPSS